MKPRKRCTPKNRVLSGERDVAGQKKDDANPTVTDIMVPSSQDKDDDAKNSEDAPKNKFFRKVLKSGKEQKI